jgi:tRNA A37 threonylcarbamoyladenosine modification protein TsaB
VAAALDARRQEVYAALFRIGPDGRPQRISPDEALSPDALAARLKPPAVVVGDAVEAHASLFGPRATLRPFASHHPRGGVVARLGAERLARGEAIDVGAAEPVYVRPPQVERADQGPR